MARAASRGEDFIRLSLLLATPLMEMRVHRLPPGRHPVACQYGGCSSCRCTGSPKGSTLVSFRHIYCASLPADQHATLSAEVLTIRNAGRSRSRILSAMLASSSS